MLIINLLIVTIIHSTMDFSYAKNYVSQFIQLTIVIFVSSYIFFKHPDPKASYIEYAEKIIVWIFLVQSIIEIIAFLIPEFASLVHLTYDDKTLKKIYEGYGGIRGLALAGSPGWGLAVGFGLSFLFYTKAYIINKKLTFITVLMAIILVVGTFFAGRSGFVGAILGVIYYCFSKGNLLLKFKNFIYGIILFFLTVIAIYLLFPSFTHLLVEKVFPFVFEFYYKYETTGIIQTSSTNTLLNMWSIPISENTYIYGTGLFTDPIKGTYYMETDVGYIRNLLFGGIFWVIMVIIYHLYINCFIFLRSKMIDSNTKLFILFLTLYALILEAKAMTIGYNKYIFIILSFYFISLIYETKKIKINAIKDGQINFNNHPDSQ